MHTPEPWRTEYHPGQRGEPATLIMQRDAQCYEKWIAECHWGRDGDTEEDGDSERDCRAIEAQANAARIVRCVNACCGVPNAALQDGSVMRLVEAAKAAAECYLDEDPYYETAHEALVKALEPFKEVEARKR